MSGFLVVLGLFGLIYGWRRPDGALPGAFGEPSRGKVVGLYGTMALAGVVGSGGDGVETGVSEAGAVDTTTASWSGNGAEAPPTDPWPGRDSTLLALVELVETQAYAQASDEALRHAAQPYAASVADSLRRIADTADELTVYERARRLSSRDLSGNRDAYAELARRWPRSPRLPIYVQKRADYDQRIIDAEAARFRALTAPRRASRRGGGSGCCKRCTTGKPCGNSCISRSYTCHQPPGCAC